MSRSQATILTNMCLIEDGRGNIVMQIRDPKRYSWSGAALPGGHIEAHEGLVESVNEAADYSELSISDIASIVYDDWKKVDRYAAPYLDAMLDLENITDRYFMDSGVSVVAYFLSNARTWKGSVAKDVKKELNKRLKNPR